MTTRRSFIRIAAGSMLPATLPAFATTDALDPRGGKQDLHAVVVDGGSAAALDFGRSFARQGVEVVSLRDGDVTPLWLNRLRPAWAQRRAAIAGLTAPTALFCLEQLGWPQGLRVVFHAEHILLPDGRVIHSVHRAGLPAPSTTTLTRAGVHWPTRLADTLRAPAFRRGARPGPSLAALQPAMPPEATLLTSWLIA